jgi:pSer/pThr/pTyr-binding forkhead associated (FHA) protein
MADNSSISDDPGTILDSYDSILKNLPLPPPVAVLAVKPARPPAEEVLYRSPYRWKAPRVLICDDDSLDEGETVRVRSEKIVIGRTKGDILIQHDVAMSGAHAEVVRQDAGGRHAWVLRDLGSSNGTLVRAKAVTLKPATTVLIGSKRFRFEEPGAAQPISGGEGEPGTALLADLGMVPSDNLPALVESVTPGGSTPLRYPFRTTRVRIGRPGYGNDIEIDDLCLTGTHAVVTRDYSGAWQIEAQPSLNGVWVKVDAIKLVDNCLFQCGEQRFRFRL